MYALHGVITYVFLLSLPPTYLCIYLMESKFQFCIHRTGRPKPPFFVDCQFYFCYMDNNTHRTLAAPIFYHNLDTSCLITPDILSSVSVSWAGRTDMVYTDMVAVGESAMHHRISLMYCSRNSDIFGHALSASLLEFRPRQSNRNSHTLLARCTCRFP